MACLIWLFCWWYQAFTNTYTPKARIEDTNIYIYMYTFEFNPKGQVYNLRSHNQRNMMIDMVTTPNETHRHKKNDDCGPDLLVLVDLAGDALNQKRCNQFKKMTFTSLCQNQSNMRRRLYCYANLYPVLSNHWLSRLSMG